MEKWKNKKTLVLSYSWKTEGVEQLMQSAALIKITEYLCCQMA